MDIWFDTTLWIILSIKHFTWRAKEQKINPIILSVSLAPSLYLPYRRRQNPEASGLQPPDKSTPEQTCRWEPWWQLQQTRQVIPQTQTQRTTGEDWRSTRVGSWRVVVSMMPRSWTPSSQEVTLQWLSQWRMPQPPRCQMPAVDADPEPDQCPDPVVDADPPSYHYLCYLSNLLWQCGLLLDWDTEVL